jgi:3-deoxy-D-manno-octulosonate 8-phosphate phosphatase (KDO 8-P phosphatase)
MSFEKRSCTSSTASLAERQWNAQWFLRGARMTPLEHVQRAARVKLMIFDVDGVLTDGSLTYDANGEITKTFYVLDGLGIQLLNRTGQHDKRLAFAELLEKTGVMAEECGYIGDDVIDLPLLTRVGFAVTVPSGHPEVQYRAHYVTKNPGGRGAVREICDMVMRAQGSYEQALAPYFG